MTGTIDERTRIPLFASIVAIPVMAGIFLWAGAITDRVSASEARLDRQGAYLERTNESFKSFAKDQLGIAIETRDRVIRIEEQIKIIKERK